MCSIVVVAVGEKKRKGSCSDNEKACGRKINSFGNYLYFPGLSDWNCIQPSFERTYAANTELFISEEITRTINGTFTIRLRAKYHAIQTISTYAAFGFSVLYINRISLLQLLGWVITNFYPDSIFPGAIDEVLRITEIGPRLPLITGKMRLAVNIYNEAFNAVYLSCSASTVVIN